MSNKNTISCIYNIVYNMKGNNMTWIIYITTEKKIKLKQETMYLYYVSRKCSCLLTLLKTSIAIIDAIILFSRVALLLLRYFFFTSTWYNLCVAAKPPYDVTESTQEKIYSLTCLKCLFSV